MVGGLYGEERRLREQAEEQMQAAEEEVGELRRREEERRRRQSYVWGRFGQVQRSTWVCSGVECDAIVFVNAKEVVVQGFCVYDASTKELFQ